VQPSVTLQDVTRKASVAGRRAVAFLSCSPNTFFGRMIELILRQTKCALAFDKRYETDMAEGVKMMALQGQGLAFLPESMVTGDVADRLAPADGGQTEWSVQMDIRLYRERPTAQRPGKSTVARLWTHLSDRRQTLVGIEDIQPGMAGVDSAVAERQRKQYASAR
jgi:DNA-binding transcriptional LysR family regulator